MNKAVILKLGREKAVLRGHPWIFSGAIESMPSFENGEILPVHSATGKFLASAYFHSTNSIAGRILTFFKEDVEKAIRKKIEEAHLLRSKLFDFSRTNCYRLINSEGDGLPGLIVDHYAGYLVLQINTCGMERLKPLLIQFLQEIVRPIGIYEKSTSSARREDGLADAQGWHAGQPVSEVAVCENGLPLIAPIEKGQKTGLFLDHREMRQLIRYFSKDRRVLNCFSYTGGFSLYALHGGAKEATSLDSSKFALEIAKKNTEDFADCHHCVEEDVFAFLKKSPLNYDLIILDPPAFIKKRRDIENGSNAYREINRQVLEKCPSGTFLLSSSCSYYLDETAFQKVLFEAAHAAKREVRILSRHLLAADHPISLAHPEGNYLKSLFVYVT